MTIERIRLILYDYFDINKPINYMIGSRKFKEESYKRWAVDELISYIASIVSPDYDVSIDRLISIVWTFNNKCQNWALIKGTTQNMFTTAGTVSYAFIEILEAWK